MTPGSDVSLLDPAVWDTWNQEALREPGMSAGSGTWNLVPPGAEKTSTMADPQRRNLSTRHHRVTGISARLKGFRAFRPSNKGIIFLHIHTECCAVMEGGGGACTLVYLQARWHFTNKQPSLDADVIRTPPSFLHPPPPTGVRAESKPDRKLPHSGSKGMEDESRRGWNNPEQQEGVVGCFKSFSFLGITCLDGVGGYTVIRIPFLLLIWCLQVPACVIKTLLMLSKTCRLS